jgi:hypothetical protein
MVDFHRSQFQQKLLVRFVADRGGCALVEFLAISSICSAISKISSALKSYLIMPVLSSA